jgi:tetratricopeptide (TPR) repeat protein
LANLFLDEGNTDKCIAYFKKALEKIETMKGRLEEIEANRNLGEALLIQGDIFVALKYFQKSYTIVIANGYTAGEELARASLMHIHTAIADQLESNSNFEEAIPHHQKCLEFITSETAPNEVYYRLGKAYQHTGLILFLTLGKIATAILNLELFLKSARKYVNAL